ncbi:hypothetical protein N7495_006458 [Penicillium taxi]|uniref:uncharacterized protein n=1 Tax=Penicillium taxi TaxID=168475 RepID=UPI002544EBCD|nr:uncharacterized protein N7495_006458 [Penicillium taxi]KAJ5894767.1 hypothetical protein N7495_006458 [Penicillium taxi]
MDLQSPSVLAQLPHPLHASTGKTRIGDVYSLADAKKRKRYEVAVAVDGEAVNIYNVQTPKLVTSYAVPPQSTFSCRPCSVRRKLSKNSIVKRQTYAAVTKPEHQIKCFVEEIGNGTSSASISSSAATITDSRSPTIFVGIVPFGADNDIEADLFDILSVHEDGRVRRFSSDLKTQRWSIQHSEISKVSSTHEVNSCFLIDLDDAKKALFKRRQDLAALALGDRMGSELNEPSILIVVSHPKAADAFALNDVIVQIFSVPASPQSRSNEESQRLRHLQTINVPAPSGLDRVNSDGLQWSFHSGSAGLQLSFEKGFVSVDISQYSPSVTSQFILDDHFSSVMRISPQCVIGASDSLVAVYDTQYQSAQRSIPAKDVLSGSASTSDGPTIFISYFAKLGIAVATKKNTLIAFDLTSLNINTSSSLKRSRDGLLIDAIGRGIGSSAAQWDMASKKHRSKNMTSLHLTSPDQIEKWNQLTKAVDEATKAQDSDKFDQAVLNYFSSPLPKKGTYINPESTLFLLSKIFAVKESAVNDDVLSPSSSQLRVAIWPQATCHWLILLGHMSVDNVEIALRRSYKPRILPSLPTGSFVQAVIEFDSTLKHINAVLSGPSVFTSDELAYGLKYFLNLARMHSGPLEEAARALTNGDVDTPTQALIQPNGDMASVKQTFRGLNISLQKIHSQSLPSIVQSLRSNLSRVDLISMIHHLRLSLATGGYTSRFTENPPTPITRDQITPTLSLKTIIDLITASVDAVGPSGWISALPTINDIDDDSASAIAAASREMELISDMRSEISAALAGVEEATYLSGILREYLCFAEKVTAPRNLKHVEKATSSLIRHERLNGATLMVYSTPEAGEDGFEGETGGKMLPLSMKPPSKKVSRTKVKKSTGEKKDRSGREIGLLRRKAVGKYSFERLVL